MKTLKFKLSGDHAFFKDSSINTVYLTYGNIHRVALLGLFGAILGLGGYNQQSNQLTKDKDRKYKKFPEFYEKLKNLKIGIVPNSENGTFTKKLQMFNNSVGYASQEQGNNLIVSQYWLENPSWDIYLMIDNEYSEKIADYIVNNKAVYLPYLGANNHFADISEVNIFDTILITEEKPIGIKSYIMPENADIINNPMMSTGSFKYQENLPYELDENFNKHILKKVMVTDYDLKVKNVNVYRVNESNIVFY